MKSKCNFKHVPTEKNQIRNQTVDPFLEVRPRNMGTKTKSVLSSLLSSVSSFIPSSHSCRANLNHPHASRTSGKKRTQLGSSQLQSREFTNRGLGGESRTFVSAFEYNCDVTRGGSFSCLCRPPQQMLELDPLPIFYWNILLWDHVFFDRQISLRRSLAIRRSSWLVGKISVRSSNR